MCRRYRKHGEWGDKKVENEKEKGGKCGGGMRRCEIEDRGRERGMGKR